MSILNAGAATACVHTFVEQRHVADVVCVERYRDNFIKMDIFYQDLSDSNVVTNVGFDLFSLFSEIGSLMGLLLGASLLTACELIDYLSLLQLVKCAIRGRKKA